jgi:hypothetical protein
MRSYRATVVIGSSVEIVTNFDGNPILKHLDRIERDVEELRAALPVELAEWQEDDLNRRWATTKTIDVERPTANFTRAATTVNPTSRYRIKKRRRIIRRLKKSGQAHQITRSNRPVLRAALLKDFHERFIRLLHSAF